MLKKILLAIAFLPTIAFAQSGTISQLSQWISSGSYIKMASTTAGFRIPSLNCTSKTNGGALTADASGFITCTDDDGSAGGSQTPWVGNINGATFSLSNVGSLDATSSVITQATSTNFYTANLKLGTLSGLLKATNGTVGTATAGTDYENPLTVVSPITRTVNALGFDFSTQNTWSGHNIFSSFYATRASSTYATTTSLDVTGTGTSTFSGPITIDSHTAALTVHNVQAHASDGIFMRSNAGTNIALIGAGGGQGATFYGGVNIDGATRLATSLTGLLQAYSGTVSAVATSSLNLLVGSFLSPNISQWTNDSGYITSASLPVGGNPTASVGVTAVNGVATTFMRSDASPALDSGLYSTFNGKVSSSSLSATYPLAYNSATGAFTFGGLGTTTTWTTGQLAYVVNGNTLTSVATGTISATLPISVTASRYAIGGATAFSIADAVADGATKGAASFASADFDSASGNITIDATITRDTELSGLSNSKWATTSTYINPNVSGTGIIVNSSSTIFRLTSDTSTSTSATSTDFFSTRAKVTTLTTTNFISNLTGLLLGAGTGNTTAYGGTSCTNQFVRSINASGVASCATVSSSDVSLANLSATDSTLTFSGTYTGATARTIGINLNNANTWTGAQTIGQLAFTNATGTSVYASASSTFQILNVGSLTMPSKSDGCATFASGVLNSTGSACGSGGGGDSKFSTSTINPLAIFMNAGDSLGLGTTTNRSALSMLALATTTGNHLTMRNGNTTWFQKVNDTGSWFMGTTSGAYATATHSALIVPTTGGLIVQGSGSSTLRNGITIEAGCFSVNGTCIGSGGTLTGSNASAGRVGFWSSANNIDGDGDFTWDGALNKLFALKGAFSTSLEIATGTAPTVDRVGGIAFDTTDNQFLIGTTTDVSVAVLPTRQKLWGATIASTSLEMVSGGRLWLPPQRDGFDIMEIHCAVDAGTSVVINISNSGGTTDTETVTCDADGAVDTSIGTNPSYAAGSLNSLEIGTITGAVDYLTFSVWGNIKRE